MRNNIEINNERCSNIKKLESMVLNFLKQLTTEKTMYIELPNRHSAFVTRVEIEEKDTKYKENCLASCKKKPSKLVAFHRKKQIQRFVSIIRIIKLSYELLCQKKYATKRDIYYTDTELFNDTQLTVDEIIDDLAALLHTSRHKLHVVASARGLVYGPLRFQERNGNDSFLVDCRHYKESGGLCITPIIERLSHFHIYNNSGIPSFILIVEKDAVFQRLLQDGFCDRYPCIMITGKGYPDLATRMFWTTLMRNYSQVNNNLHCFILTDADPHGIDIARVYKYGSQSMEYMNKELCLQVETENHLLQRVHWIGLNIVTDFELFLMSEKCKIEIDELDKRKIDTLLQEFNTITKHSINSIIPKKTIHSVRYNDYYQWKQQLEFMNKYNLKAEIQALSSRGLLFLSTIYLPAKMNQILKAMHCKCSQ